MALLPIIIAPDPRLKVTAKAVIKVDDDVRRLMDDLLETMHSANGIGLAAPQVGDHRRVIVVDVANEDEDPNPLCMANPELVWVSDENGTHEEGCLSLPGVHGEIDLTDAETDERVLLTIRKGTLDQYHRELQSSFRQLESLLSNPAYLYLRFTTNDSVEDTILHRFRHEGLLA